MLTIDRLQVKYGTQTALLVERPIDITPGDRIGVIGANGAGKSTLLKAVLGLVPYHGRIRTKLLPEQISVHMQQNNYVNTMSVKHLLSGILGINVNTDQKLAELIDFFDFRNCLCKKFSMLSGGQKQRLTVILVLYQDAPLTFFDEVTSGLDFETRQKLVDKIRAWYKGKNAALVVVSHYYDELERLAEKLLILDRGRVVDFGKTETLFARYCGRAVVILENNERNNALVSAFRKIEAPAHLIALSCKNEAEEARITALCLNNNVDYKRSTSDIELLYTGALAQNGGGT